MIFRRATLETCGGTTGAAVVIDVLRAFTTAAYAFSAGADRIALVATVEEALALKEAHPGSVLTGEVGGLPPAGFDHGNSPAAMESLDLAGKTLIQRTSAGTQGVVRCRLADPIFVSGFCTAWATVKRLRALRIDRVTFVPTGIGPEAEGDADVALADYLQKLLENPEIDLDADPSAVDAAPFLERVRASTHGRRFTGAPHSGSPAVDLACALKVNRFDFAMRIRREGALPCLGKC